jgi:hypothetical protein
MIELVSGYKPKNDSFLTTLPPLRQTNSFNDHVKINLSANISFDQINEKLAQQFVEKPILLEGDEYKINIKEAKAFPYGNKIMIALDVDGKVTKGKISDKIMSNKEVYNEAINKEISEVRYLIEYMNNNKKQNL